MTDRNNYDLQVVLDKPSVDIENALNEYGKVTGTVQLSGVIPRGGEEIETTVTVLPMDTEAVRLYTSQGDRIYLLDEGIVISQKLADTHGIKAGDIITLRLISTVSVMEIRVSVASICRSYFGQGIFMSFEALENFEIVPSVYTYYINTENGADEIWGIQDIDGVKAVYTKNDMKEFLSSTQDLMSAIIFVMIAASAVLTLAVIFNITSINIFDRRRDIATLRVLGYHHKEVGRLILVENLILTAFGCIIGLGLGCAMQYALIRFIGTETTYFPFMLVWWCIPVAVISVFLFTFIVNLLSKKKIRSIGMVESLKSVE